MSLPPPILELNTVMCTRVCIGEESLFLFIWKFVKLKSAENWIQSSQKWQPLFLIHESGMYPELKYLIVKNYPKCVQKHTFLIRQVWAERDMEDSGKHANWGCSLTQIHSSALGSSNALRGWNVNVISSTTAALPAKKTAQTVSQLNRKWHLPNLKEKFKSMVTSHVRNKRAMAL